MSEKSGQQTWPAAIRAQPATPITFRRLPKNSAPDLVLPAFGVDHFPGFYWPISHHEFCQLRRPGLPPQKTKASRTVLTWNGNRLGFHHGLCRQIGIPLPGISHMLDCQLYGNQNPVATHVPIFILHVINSILLSLIFLNSLKPAVSLGAVHLSQPWFCAPSLARRIG